MDDFLQGKFHEHINAKRFKDEEPKAIVQNEIKEIEKDKVLRFE